MSSFTCDCSADVDGCAEFYAEEFPVARKEHKCCECGEKILPQNKYHKAVGKWEGDFQVFKTCMPCYNIREHYCAGGYYFGELAEQIRECLGFDYREEVKP